jgi:hypothetical protein
MARRLDEGRLEQLFSARRLPPLGRELPAMNRTRRIVLASLVACCLGAAGNACIAVRATDEPSAGKRPAARAVVTGIRLASASGENGQAPTAISTARHADAAELFVARRDAPFLTADARAAESVPAGWQVPLASTPRRLPQAQSAQLRPQAFSLRAFESPVAVILPHHDFADSGPGTLDASMSGLDVDALRSVAGARMQLVAAEDERGRVLAETRLSWLFEYLQTEAGEAAFFAPGEKGIFAVQGLNYGSNWLLLGWGFRFELPGGLTAYTHYDAQANAAEVFHIGSGGFGYAW